METDEFKKLERLRAFEFRLVVVFSSGKFYEGSSIANGERVVLSCGIFSSGYT